MSYYLPPALYRMLPAACRGNAFLLYNLAVARSREGVCHERQVDLAAETGLDVATVRRLERQLQEAKLVRVENGGRGNRRVLHILPTSAHPRPVGPRTDARTVAPPVHGARARSASDEVSGTPSHQPQGARSPAPASPVDGARGEGWLVKAVSALIDRCGVWRTRIAEVCRYVETLARTRGVQGAVRAVEWLIQHNVNRFPDRSRCGAATVGALRKWAGAPKPPGADVGSPGFRRPAPPAGRERQATLFGDRRATCYAR